MHGFHYKLLYNQERIVIKDRILRLRKISGIYNDLEILYLFKEFSQLHNYNDFIIYFKYPKI